MKELLDKFRQAGRAKKVIYILAFLLALLILFFVIAYCVGSLFYLISDKTHSKLYVGLHGSVLPLTLFIYGVLIIFVLIQIFRIDKRNFAGKTDANGVSIMEKGTYGSSRFMDSAEVGTVFEVIDIASTTTTIYGQLTEKGEKVVGYKKPKFSSANRNVLLMAIMGSGKSFTYIRTELIQAVLRGDSVIVTDPSVELFTDLGQFCINHGANVKVLNLAEPKYSDFWNPLEEVIDPDTERIDSTRLGDFVEIFMQNSGNGDKDFWYQSALNLLKAIIGLAAWDYEDYVSKRYCEVYKSLTGRNDLELKTEKRMISFPQMRKEILDSAVSSGYDPAEIEEILARIKKDSPHKLNIETIFKIALEFDEKKKGFENIPDWYPAKYSFKMYQTNDNENVRSSALQGTQLNLQIFIDDNLRNVTSHEGIHVSDINKQQSVYFVITSDKTTTTKPLASLFFSFVFKDAQETYDSAAQIAKSTGTENKTLPLVALLDEFYSLGVLGGSVDAFGTIMSNSRKRNIYMNISIQTYTQLEALYGKNIRNIIQSGCDVLLYMGGNDPDTCRFVSEFASGESTVLAESHQEAVGIFTDAESTFNVSAGKRFLLTVDDARRWKNKVLCVKHGEYPLELKPFPWIEHPVYLDHKTIPISVYDYLKPLNMRLDEMIETEKADPETEIHEAIEKLEKQPMVQPEKILEPNPSKKEEEVLPSADDLFANDGNQEKIQFTFHDESAPEQTPQQAQEAQLTEPGEEKTGEQENPKKPDKKNNNRRRNNKGKPNIILED